jgi:hypothetical protein
VPPPISKRRVRRLRRFWPLAAALAFGLLLTLSVAIPADVPVEPAAAASNVQRIFGATRIETAIAISRDSYPAAASADAVVVARSDTFPDALAGVPLAAHVHGPLLLTPSARLAPAVAAEISRVAPRGATVYILGSTAAIATGVEAEVRALGDTPKRIFGADRYATAVAIAHELGDPTLAFEATGLNFPDALAAGPAAIVAGGAILLTAGSHQAPATAAYLSAHPGGVHYALGGAAAAADPAAKAFIGRDRYATAAAIADQFFPAASTIGVATAWKFPDAAAAGPDLAARGAPLLLVPPAGPLPPAPTTELLVDFGTAQRAVVFGSTASVGDDVASQAGVLAGAGPAARAAGAAAQWSARYGVRAETLAVVGAAVTRTVVVDGGSGDETVYTDGAPATTTSADEPTRAELAALPLAIGSLVPAVNELYAAFDRAHGISSSDPDVLFFSNAEQVVLNPVAPPILRLATYAALAGLPTTTVASGVADSTGRIGIAVSAVMSGNRVAYVFDPQTALPLENIVADAAGVVVSRETIASMTTVASAPIDPYM